jgi:hypothetical protein
VLSDYDNRYNLFRTFVNCLEQVRNKNSSCDLMVAGFLKKR